MKTKAFTFIELLIVVSIIAILSSILVHGAKERRADAEFKKVLGYATEIKGRLGHSLIAEWKMDVVDNNKVIYDSGRLSITGTGSGITAETNCPENKCIQLSGEIEFNFPKIKARTICFWGKGGDIELMEMSFTAQDKWQFFCESISEDIQYSIIDGNVVKSELVSSIFEWENQYSLKGINVYIDDIMIFEDSIF
jgi:prepilin-type N-terminal cleavage/methylation domain-containing protein